MDRLSRLSEYGTIYMREAARLGNNAATYRDARAWMEATGLEPATAAELASKGHTPDKVAKKVEEAYERGDERDADRVADQLLFGPDVA